MKFLLTILLILSSSLSYSQEGEDHPMPDSSLVVSFPWYGNNQYLTDFLADRGYVGNGSNFRIGCPGPRYQLPVRIVVFRYGKDTYKSLFLI